MARFVCSACKTVFSVPAHSAGQDVECFECGAPAQPYAQGSTRYHEETAIAGLVLLLGGGALAVFLFFLSDSIAGGAALASLGIVVSVTGYILHRRFGGSDEKWDNTEKHCPNCNRTTPVYRKKFDAAPHAALTIITLGAWLIGWGICWQMQRKWRCAACESILGRNAAPATDDA